MTHGMSKYDEKERRKIRRQNHEEKDERYPKRKGRPVEKKEED